MKATYTSRPYTDPGDLPAVLALVRARPAAQALDFPSLADLRELLGVAHIREAARLWEAAGGRLAGFAILNIEESYAGLTLEISQGEDTDTLGAQMVAWGEDACRSQSHTESAYLSASANASDTVRVALLERRGFARQEEAALQLERDLSQPIPPPEIAAGFQIRSLHADEEEAWVGLHRTAFGTENMTLEYRQSMSRSPDYDPQIDLVATAPNGSLAAYAFGSISREENALTGLKIGYADPVGTHPDFQRKGLARALLLECLRRLRERGMETARMGTSSGNTAMQRAAESAGFRVTRRTLLFEKSMAHE